MRASVVGAVYFAVAFVGCATPVESIPVGSLMQDETRVRHDVEVRHDWTGETQEFQITPASWWDNPLAAPQTVVVANQGEASPYARLVYDTDAAWMLVRTETNYGVLKFTGFAVRIDGRRAGAYTNGATGVLEDFVVPLPHDGAMHRVEVVNVGGNYPVPTWQTTSSVAFPKASVSHAVAPQPGTHGLAVIGDSIYCGFQAEHPAEKGLTALLREPLPGRSVVNLSYGGMTVRNWTGAGANADLLARLHASGQLDDIWIALGGNDWGASGFSAAQIAGWADTMLRSIRREFPNARVWWAAPTVREYWEGWANAGGSTLDDVRAALKTTAEANGARFVSTASWLTFPDDYGDYIHPNTAGDAKMAGRILEVLR